MNNIIKFIFFTLFCFCCCFYAQPQNINSGNSKETNLFEYGEPLTSCEVNLKNLFNNFPKFVKNANNIDLLSYKYIGIIKNRKEARNFVKKNIYPNAPGWSVSISYENEGSNNFPKVWLETAATVGSNKSELNEIIKTISEEYVQPGYEVYMIKFVCVLKTHEYYIFINTETKQAVTKGNIFGFSLPIY